MINEASGLAISRDFADRLYRHNHSGGGPYCYITTFSGANTQRVKIQGYNDSGQDLEDMAPGPCGQESGRKIIDKLGAGRDRSQPATNPSSAVLA